MASKKRYILHRGLRRSQEFPNSFEALKDQHGVEIEVDVFLVDTHVAALHSSDQFILEPEESADGSPVPQHGVREHVDLTAEEIEALDFETLRRLHVSGVSTGLEGERVPLLSEYLLEAFHNNDTLDVELKATTPEQAAKLARAVVREVHQMKLLGLFADRPNYPTEHFRIFSLSIDALLALREAEAEYGEQFTYGLAWMPDVQRAMEHPLTGTAVRWTGWHVDDDHPHTASDWARAGINVAMELNCHFMGIHKSTCTKPIIDEIHDHGMSVYAWIVNHHGQAKRLLKLGVDKIITESRP